MMIKLNWLMFAGLLILAFGFGGLTESIFHLSDTYDAPAPDAASQGTWNVSTIEGDGEPLYGHIDPERDNEVEWREAFELEFRIIALEVEVEKLSELALMQSDLILKLTIKLCDGGDTE